MRRGWRLLIVAAVIVVIVLAAAWLGGWGRDLRIYRGDPEDFSPHPYRILYPAHWQARKLPRSRPDVIGLVAFHQKIPPSSEVESLGPLIVVRCHRMREQETAKGFSERMYDDLAPRYLELKLRRVRRGPSGGAEYELAVKEPYLVTRMIPLPREKIAYTVETSAEAGERKKTEALFRRVRKSFELLSARD